MLYWCLLLFPIVLPGQRIQLCLFLLDSYLVWTLTLLPITYLYHPELQCLTISICLSLKYIHTHIPPWGSELRFSASDLNGYFSAFSLRKLCLSSNWKGKKFSVLSWKNCLCSEDNSMGLSAKRASLVAQLVKNPSTMQGTRVQLLGQEDPLETG